MGCGGQDPRRQAGGVPQKERREAPEYPLHLDRQLFRISDFLGRLGGGLVVSFSGAGFPRSFDSFLAVWLAYDVAFGSASGFRQSDWGTPGDLRDDINVSEVLPIFLPQFSDSGSFGKFEFMRLVYGGLDDWYVSDSGSPPA